jgi:hypothetical protein
MLLACVGANGCDAGAFRMHGPGAITFDQLVMMRLPRNEVAEA